MPPSNAHHQYIKLPISIYALFTRPSLTASCLASLWSTFTHELRTHAHQVRFLCTIALGHILKRMLGFVLLVIRIAEVTVVR